MMIIVTISRHLPPRLTASCDPTARTPLRQHNNNDDDNHHDHGGTDHHHARNNYNSGADPGSAVDQHHYNLHCPHLDHPGRIAARIVDFSRTLTHG